MGESIRSPFDDERDQLSEEDRALIAGIQEDAAESGSAEWAQLSTGMKVLVEPQDDGSVHWYVTEGEGDG